MSYRFDFGGPDKDIDPSVYKGEALQLEIAKILEDKIIELCQIAKEVTWLNFYQVHDSIVVRIPEGISPEDYARITKALDKLQTNVVG